MLFMSRGSLFQESSERAERDRCGIYQSGPRPSLITKAGGRVEIATFAEERQGLLRTIIRES